MLLYPTYGAIVNIYIYTHFPIFLFAYIYLVVALRESPTPLQRKQMKETKF